VLAVLVLVSACAGAEPTEAVVRPDGSPLGWTVPVEYERSPTDIEGVTGVELARPGGSAGQTQPFGRIVHRRLSEEVVQRLARRDLRLITAEGVDPLVVSRTQPGSMQVIDYAEIDDAEWWGSRIRVVLPTESSGDVVLDRLVLVGRADGDLLEAEFTCNPGCFADFGDEIDEILSSWTMEDAP
jgi:hypothetical protein